MRIVGAAVRALFVAEAARGWGIDPVDVTVEAGELRSPDGRSASYAELAGSVDLDVDVDADIGAEVTVKDVDGARLVGSSAARSDLPDKVAGRPRYITDLRLPGMLFGRVVRPPSPGARLTSVGDEAATAATQSAAVWRSCATAPSSASWAPTSSR